MCKDKHDIYNQHADGCTVGHGSFAVPVVTTVLFNQTCAQMSEYMQLEQQLPQAAAAFIACREA